MEFEYTIKGEIPQDLPEVEMAINSGKYFSALFQIREKLIYVNNNVKHKYIEELVKELLDMIPDLSNIP